MTTPKPGTLYVVATPIGHLGDLSTRAATVLAEADVVLCEDTRHTGVLLRHLGLQKATWSLHAHNEEARVIAVLDRLHAGETLALVSDAGTPCLSDPGAHLIDAVHAAGMTVRTVPGPFATAAALAGSGLTPVPFAFWGFLAKKTSERRAQLRIRLQPGPEGPMTHAFYVPGRDLADFAEDLAEIAPATRVVVARELTKIHEGWLRGTPAQVQAQLTEEQLRGEAVVLVEVAPGNVQGAVQVPVDAGELVRAAKAAGRDRKFALKEIGERTGLSRNDLYQLWLDAGEDPQQA
jgi:16S rRNA (cytidine1402-2'-O)-methyltransferase